ncbi:MAG: energy transducer TonB [Gammaproteobacteria bacterium]
MLKKTSGCDSFDAVEKSVPKKLMLAIFISVFLHAIFFAFTRFNNATSTSHLPLHIAISEVTSRTDLSKKNPVNLKNKPSDEVESAVIKLQKKMTAKKKPKIANATVTANLQKKNLPTDKRIIDESEVLLPSESSKTVALNLEPTDESVIESSVVLQKISYLHNPSPKYPRRARKMGIEGNVLIHVNVLESGVAGELIIKKSSGSSLLDNAALKAVRDWRFMPAQQNRKTISSWIDIPIRFQLDG